MNELRANPIAAAQNPRGRVRGLPHRHPRRVGHQQLQVRPPGMGCPDVDRERHEKGIASPDIHPGARPEGEMA